MTTQGCHLCDQAIEVMLQVLDADRFCVDLVDIAFDDRLMGRYATRIPVLVVPASGAELNWPFGAEQLRSFSDQALSARCAPGEH
ncbi:glutaredoxin family protein [Nitrincola iocasae]|uniref:Glutaredoxin family protein n=2 Tax=Nitrincola iocasae TaxID=2614693 RepID=A0A5J6LJJ6_9GAMM|nr:glutaredoxin family protein [Nitrincola iocasae]